MSYSSESTPKLSLRKLSTKLERVVGVEECLPDALLVRVRRDHRQLREHPDRVQLDVLGVVRVGLALVVGRERRGRRREHRHRVRGGRQRREESLEVFVQQRVVADALVERSQLVGAGQFAVDEQPGDLEVGAVLRQLLDRVPAIAEDALVAVDEGDRRLGRRGVDEAVVEGRVPGLPCERRDVHTGGAAVGSAQQREIGRLIADREGGFVLLNARVGHGASSRFLVVPGVSTPCRSHRGAISESRRDDVRCRATALLQPNGHISILRTRPKGTGIRWRKPPTGHPALKRSAAASIRSSVAVSDSLMCCGKCSP